MQEQKNNSNTKIILIRIAKIIIFTLILCGVMTLALKFYIDSVSEAVDYLEKEERPNTVWLVKNSALVLPTVSIAVLLTIAYKIGNGYIPVKTQIDKAIICFMVGVFIYAVLLSYVCLNSVGWRLPPAEGAEDVKSLLERSIQWFVVQALPFLIMISYHLIRASSEKKEIAEACNEEE